MDLQNDFSASFSAWLSSTGFRVVVRRDVGEVFDVAEIFKENKMVLVIKMIDLKQWLEDGRAVGEFTAYFHELESSRAAKIHSIVLWEDLWITKPDIVKSRIMALLGSSQRIPARLTKARRIDKNTAAGFLTENHLQGTVSSKTQYGLYLPHRYFRVLRPDFQVETDVAEMLVAVATFSHPRIFLHTGKSFRSFEMIRFANLLNTTVVGGLDKLLSAFGTDFKPGDIMTYADLEWSDGSGYKRLGFEQISDTGSFHFFLALHSLERISHRNRNEEQAGLVEIMNAGSRKFVKSFHEEEHNTKPSSD